MITTMTSKGQVTIPKKLRDYLGLKPGAAVEFELADDGQVVLKSARRPRKSALARLRGSIKGRWTTDEIMALTRGEH
ncbi:MAG: AbrB/MazE/SpoVT family DNA-binding domain-containing protein [Bradyrhizobiaceae bacterium]|nr:AbrB/MazE/SpoVT family DNA-binding domain-containing protein [Bradyrhizobiaceae bacterium]